MRTITITLPTNKKNSVKHFTISFSSAKFEQVIDLVSTIKTVEELRMCSLWTVI